MNRTLKDATVKRYHYETHEQLRAHLQLFVDAYNHARRLKTLRGLTPYEHVLQVWTKEPERFRLDPSHHIPGPYTSVFRTRSPDRSTTPREETRPSPHTSEEAERRPLQAHRTVEALQLRRPRFGPDGQPPERSRRAFDGRRGSPTMFGSQEGATLPPTHRTGRQGARRLPSR